MILSASRTTTRTLPRPKTAVARSGLSYERSLFNALLDAKPKTVSLERGPWFQYRDSRSLDPLVCQPDILAFDEEFKFYIVIEAKRTWVPTAGPKLSNIYCPVIRAALDAPVKPLMICQILTPLAPMPRSSVSFALMSDAPLVQWMGKGHPIRW